MKKLWLGILVMTISIYGYGQIKVTPIGRTGWRTDIYGNTIRLIPLISSYDPTKVLTINNLGDIVLVPGGVGYTPKVATTSQAGIVKVDGTSITIGSDSILHASPGAGEPIIAFPVGAKQYWGAGKTFHTLVMDSILGWPSISGQSGKFLTNDGTNLSWATTTGGSGLSDAYSSMTDGANTATSSGATTFKYRSANNLLTFLITNNDITHGDNLLATINQANLVLTESQITSLISHLAAKEPTITAGTTAQYWRGDKSWQTLNTANVPESGATNVYFSNLRVQQFADTRYRLWTFHDTFDSLANVDMSGKQVGDIPQWDGTHWIRVPIPTGGGSAPTIILTGDVTGSGTPTIATTIAAGVVADSKLANMANATIKGRITAGTGVPEAINMTQLKSSAMLDIANFPIQTLQAAVNSAQTTTNSTLSSGKLDKNNSAPTGTFDASATTSFKLPRNTDATLQRDTVDIMTFGGGSGITNDTTWATTSTILGSMWHTGTDTIVITNLNFIIQGVSPTATIIVYYGTTFNSGGTAIVTAGTVVTNTTTGTNVTSFNNARIPPGNYVWAAFTSVTIGSKPTYFQGTISGYKSRK